jgi:ABC-type nitrate/sulfonate/bicarbonate transport system permease component
VLAIVALSFATLLLAYWTTPFELHYHLSTSARRVITGPLLAWALALPLVIESGPRRVATLGRR